MGEELTVFDQEFARFLMQLGTGGILAGLLFFFYRKDVRSYTELWKLHAELNATMTRELMALVDKNSGTIASNTEVLKSLHRRMDRLDILRVVPEDAAHENGPR